MQIRLKQNQKHMQYWKPSILGHILSKKVYLPVAAKILNARIIVIFWSPFVNVIRLRINFQIEII